MKVVIIGGGYGGTAVAKALDRDFDVTLIEKREKFFHNSGALRAAVDPRLEGVLELQHQPGRKPT